MGMPLPEHSGQVTAALRLVVAEHGRGGLSAPELLSNLLKDLLPEVPPSLTRVLVAAAEDRVADALSLHIGQGMDLATAARLVASAFSGATMINPEASNWAVAQFATALGLAGEARPPTLVVSPSPASSALIAPTDNVAHVNQDVTVGQVAAGQAPHHDTRGAHRPSATLAHTKNLMYVTNIQGDSVTPVNLNTFLPGEPIKVGKRPAAIAISTSRATAYIASLDGTVTPVDINTGNPGWPINLGERLNAIAIVPDQSAAYVCSADSQTVTSIDLGTGRLGARISLNSNPARTEASIQGGPLAIAISPDGSTAYLLAQDSGTFTAIELATGNCRYVIQANAKANPGVTHPTSIAITSNGSTAYVVDSQRGAVVPLNLLTYTAGIPISVGTEPLAIVISRDERHAYVSNGRDGTITPIDLAARTANPPIRLSRRGGQRATGIVLSPDGAKLYVASMEDNSVIPISLVNRKPGRKIAVGEGPWVMAVG